MAADCQVLYRRTYEILLKCTKGIDDAGSEQWPMVFIVWACWYDISRKVYFSSIKKYCLKHYLYLKFEFFVLYYFSNYQLTFPRANNKNAKNRLLTAIHFLRFPCNITSNPRSEIRLHLGSILDFAVRIWCIDSLFTLHIDKISGLKICHKKVILADLQIQDHIIFRVISSWDNALR